MALAGLWETWSGKDGSEIDTAAIVTCAANGTLAAIHERMPAILDPDAVGPWLDIREVDAGRAAALCRPCPEAWLDLDPVGPRVNDVRNDDAGLMDPPEGVPVREAPRRSAPELPRQGSLF